MRDKEPILEIGTITFNPAEENEENLPYRYSEKFGYQVYRNEQWVSLIFQ